MENYLQSIFIVVLLSAFSRANPVFPPFFNTATEAPATTTESIVEIFNNAFEDPTSSDGEIITTTSDTPKDPESVHISILNDIVVESDSSSQLKNFRIPGLDEVEPGQYFYDTIVQDPFNGVHTPQSNGLFLVSTSVHVEKTSTEQVRRRRLAEDQLQEARVAVCIDGSEALVHDGVLLGSKSTFLLSGVMKLKSGQEITVKVTNKSSSKVTILKRTSVSIHKL